MNKLILMYFILCFILLNINDAGADELTSLPVYYPNGTIGSNNPYIIWFDKYNERDKKNNVKYKITVQPKEGQSQSILITPELYERYYYFYRFPLTLNKGCYEYTIDRLVDNKTTDSGYFHYKKYPVTGEFKVDPEKKSELDTLPPQTLIDYLRLDRENRLVNMNNFFFYGSAGIGAFGIGLLFYSVLEFGLVSKIVYIAAFTSSAAGFGASGYYGIKYLKEKNRLHKIIDIGSNVSFNGFVSPTDIYADFKILF